MNYQVIWRIDVEASTPREAAARAMEIQRDIDSIATIFEVNSADGHIFEVDTSNPKHFNTVKLACGCTNRTLCTHGNGPLA